jgi:hypothetical protein
VNNVLWFGTDPLSTQGHTCLWVAGDDVNVFSPFVLDVDTLKSDLQKLKQTLKFWTNEPMTISFLSLTSYVDDDG